MLEQKDIEQAKNLFTQWDLDHKWSRPSPEFTEHSRKKAKDSLALAAYILDKLSKTVELEDNDTATIWVVAASYYSMFFEVEYLLALDRKKLPEGVQDTHKTIYLAFIYYYIIKGSEFEQKKAGQMTTSRMSKALAMFKELQDETLELQRIRESVNDLRRQREQRHAFTYRMSRAAEISEARKSVEKAAKFRQLVEEYILSRQQS